MTIEHIIIGPRVTSHTHRLPPHRPHHGGAPAFFFIHVGGLVSNDAFNGIAPLIDYVEEFHAVAVDYRLAPETSRPTSLQAGHISGVGLVEGWRGTIAHRVEMGPDGTVSRLKIVDPSFFNWPALPVALTDTIVPDFPLTNKSFNLSYAGNDL